MTQLDMLDGSQPDPPLPAGGRGPDTGPREPRPLIERIGLALIALIVVAVFGAIGAASFASGEPFLALMAGIGALMTLWAGCLTLFRG